ncbi:zinc metalloprotease [Nocardioides xinjiangensis]|uniref:zinc metalloprotease n=1 Tax=Nocardioides xinjiangensis TaxID=2817376 RepID=UPI001B30899A|nr:MULTISPECIES: zinc metalloprotease [unclassified Nocardioides]
MHSTSTLVARRLGVALTALALGIGMSTPVHAAPAKDRAADCIDYGDLADAPAGTIPRDDLHHVHKDPLAKVARATASTTSRSGAGAAADAFEPVTVPVRFHVIAKDRGQEGGNLSRARIEAQVAVLNAAYEGTGFTFELERVTRTFEPQWFNLISSNGAEPRFYRGGGKEVAMKKALYGDSTSETLNIYSASLGQSLLGWAYFPSDFDADATAGNPLPQYRDGVVIDYRSLPSVAGDTGDSAVFSVYGEGDTATHEVGHWLELYHTFQGGCSEPGDHVADTAPEASPAFQCPVGRDTCAGGGADPITNFMDYTYDSCMTEFTPGQTARMQLAWTAYRAGA